MRNYRVVLLCMTAILSSGCAQLVRIDSDDYLRDTTRYGKYFTIIETELEDLLERYEQLLDKDIELTAPITHYEERDAPVWFLVLEKDGKKIRCYEDNYRRFVPPNVRYLTRWALYEGGEVTVRGKLKPWGIELTQLTYKSLVVNTNDPPS